MTSIAQAIRQEGMQTRSLEIAKNMLSKGLASNLVQELSGLSAEELMKIQQNEKAGK